MRCSAGVVFLVLVGAGCARQERPVDAGPDAPGPDTPAIDAPPDVPADSSVADARGDALLDAPTDARPDARSETGADAGVDAGRDAGRDAPTDTGTSSLVACAPEVPPGSSAGLVVSAMFWPGFQFQVTTAARLAAIGVQGHADAAAGSIHASVVRLGGPGAPPDLVDPADLVTRTLVSLPGGTVSPVITTPVDAPLAPGWYALVVGTGAHGASAASASLPSGGDRGCISAPGSGFPFSIRQSDGMLILQAAMPHLFVVLE